MSRLILCLALFASTSVRAECTALTGAGAKVFVPGTPSRVDLVIEDGKFVAVGSKVEGLTVTSKGKTATYEGRPCSHIDISGKTVTPGLIEVRGSMGLVEVGMEGGSHDLNSGDPDPVRAAFAVADAYNPNNTLIPIARVAGVTSSLVSGSGGRIAGQIAFVDHAGRTQADAVVERYVAMAGSAGGASSAQGLEELREIFDDARFWASNRASWEQRRSRDLRASGRDLEALQPVVNGEVPLVVALDRASQIEAFGRFVREQKIKAVITGGAEAWLHADALAEAGVAVVIDPYVYSSGTWSQIHARPDTAALLADAGVQVIVSGGWTHNMRLLTQAAGNAVRGGLDHDTAVRSITETPAKVFGLQGYGSLAVGDVANLVVWGADPLEIGTSVEHVVIRGVDVELTSRQTQLRDRYRTLPGTPAGALSLPTSEP